MPDPNRLAQMEKMLVAEPRDVFLNYAVGMEYAALGRIDDAVARFRTIVDDISAGHIPSHFRLAQTLSRAGRIDEAKAAFTRGIATAERVGDHHAADEMRGELSTL